MRSDDTARDPAVRRLLESDPSIRGQALRDPNDASADEAIRLVISRREADGRWITLRALRVLDRAGAGALGEVD